MTNVRFALALMALAVLAGCATNKKPDAPAADLVTDTAPAARASGDDSQDAVSGGVVGEDVSSSVKLPAELANRTVIYFAFDSDELRDENLALVAAHARFMSGNSAVRVRLEGHTDPQGTREYNIGLGERRAQAVRRALGLQGVAEARISTVSYGEERLASAGDDESSMALNRRVELVYSAN